MSNKAPKNLKCLGTVHELDIEPELRKQGKTAKIKNVLEAWFVNIFAKFHFLISKNNANSIVGS